MWCLSQQQPPREVAGKESALAASAFCSGQAEPSENVSYIRLLQQPESATNCATALDHSYDGLDIAPCISPPLQVISCRGGTPEDRNNNTDPLNTLSYRGEGDADAEVVTDSIPDVQKPTASLCTHPLRVNSHDVAYWDGENVHVDDRLLSSRSDAHALVHVREQTLNCVCCVGVWETAVAVVKTPKLRAFSLWWICAVGPLVVFVESYSSNVFYRINPRVDENGHVEAVARLCMAAAAGLAPLIGKRGINFLLVSTVVVGCGVVALGQVSSLWAAYSLYTWTMSCLQLLQTFVYAESARLLPTADFPTLFGMNATLTLTLQSAAQAWLTSTWPDDVTRQYTVVGSCTCIAALAGLLLVPGINFMTRFRAFSEHLFQKAYLDNS